VIILTHPYPQSNTSSRPALANEPLIIELSRFCYVVVVALASGG